MDSERNDLRKRRCQFVDVEGLQRLLKNKTLVWKRNYHCFFSLSLSLILSDKKADDDDDDDDGFC